MKMHEMINRNVKRQIFLMTGGAEATHNSFVFFFVFSEHFYVKL